jgi:thiosulfate dehydrogenase [quinone] large subunit
MMSVQDHAPATSTPNTTPRPTTTQRVTTTTAPTTHAASSATHTEGRMRVLAVLRVAMGLTFLWAFLDKTFGLGYSTSSAQAWVHGGSPTAGFLAHVQVGPFQSMLRAWAGAGWVDWLFMLALLGIGVALLFGVGMRLAAVAGTILLALMWAAEWPPAAHTSTGAASASTNPLIDYHFVFVLVVIVLALFAAGDAWGLGRRWAGLDIVRRNSWLR